jgi:hypothetical protein
VPGVQINRVKKNAYKLGIGIIVVFLLLLILFKNSSPFGKSNSSFASEPKKEITKIVLSDDRQKLTLEKTEENWILNGKTEPRKSSILFITRILKEIKIKSPVSPELFEAEITVKGIKPVRVKVYEKRKLIKSFFVYKTLSNIYGNIMKIREGTKPYIVYVPGYDGDIGSAFTLNELFWRPYSVFNLLPSEIESVDFENLSDTISSFSIVTKNNHYTLSDGKRNLTGWDSTLVMRYLSYFTWIPFESWALDLTGEERKRIEAREPLYRITVTPARGTKIILTLWERMTGEGSSKIKDSDRLTGKIQRSDELFIIKYFDIDPLLKKRSYFFPE